MLISLITLCYFLRGKALVIGFKSGFNRTDTEWKRHYFYPLGPVMKIQSNRYGMETTILH